MDEFEMYRKKSPQPMRPWEPGMDMSNVSISLADRNNGSPKKGDMIAVNPEDETDMWLVSEEYFKSVYELA